MLKPGAKLSFLDYVQLPAFNSSNPNHQEFLRKARTTDNRFSLQEYLVAKGISTSSKDATGGRPSLLGWRMLEATATKNKKLLALFILTGLPF